MPSGGGTIRVAGSGDSSTSPVDPFILEGVGRRIRLAQLIAPKAMQDPMALQGIVGMASSTADDGTFEQQITEMYAFNEAGQLAADLAQMPKDLAYGRFKALPKSMQNKVLRQGFEPEEYGSLEGDGDGKPSGIGRFLPVVGEVVGAVTGGLGENVLAPAADFFNMLAGETTQFYRAMKQTEAEQGELAVFNPANWAKHWGEVENGNTFVLDEDREDLRRQFNLSNSELDTYLQLSQGFLPGEIAETQGYEIGSEEHTAKVEELYTMATSDVGQQLIGNPVAGNDGLLNNYRVSFGRGVARGVGFRPEDLDNGFGRLVSGSGDLAYALFMDPTLAAGKVYKGTRLMHVINGMADVPRYTRPAQHALRVLDEGWTVEKAVGMPGLRTVVIKDAKGVEQATMSAMQYAQAERHARGAKLVADAIADPTGEKAAQALDLFPNLQGAWKPLVEESAKMIDNHNILVRLGDPEAAAQGMSKGLGDAHALLDFMETTSGYRTLVGTTFGGRNTSEFLKLPEVGWIGQQNMRAKGLLNKTIDYSIGLDKRAQEAIGTVKGGRVTQIGLAAMRPAQVAKRAAVAPVKFLHTATRHVPHSGSIELWGDNAVEEFYRLTDMGRDVGMDSATINRYRADFLGRSLKDTNGDIIHGLHSQNAATRAAVIREFNKDLLTRFDVGENHELYAKFVSEIDQMYGLDMDGSVKLGSAILATQQSKAIAIPAFRDLIEATNKYSITRSIFGRGGVLNPKMVDRVLTKYWKPSVLMRGGFIVRAASEEALAYLARFGVRQYVGIHLANSVAKRQIFNAMMEDVGGRPSKELIRKALDLDPDEWVDMVAFAGRKGKEVTPHEILSWGGSQLATPFTWATQTLDEAIRTTTKWQPDLSDAPLWRQRWAERTREWDVQAKYASMRFADANSAVVRGINRRLAAIPVMRALEDGVDAALLPTIRDMTRDEKVMAAVARSARLPNKQQWAKIIGNFSDDDFRYLREMATDPVLRQSFMEHVGGASTLNVGTEIADPHGLAEDVAQWDPQSGQFVTLKLQPVGNKTEKVLRADGEMDMQQLSAYYRNAVARLRRLWHPNAGLDEAVRLTMPQHFPKNWAERASSALERAGLPSSGDHVEDLRQLARSVHQLAPEDLATLRDAVEADDLPAVARAIAEGLGDGEEAVAMRQALESLALLDDPPLNMALLNPSLRPDQIHTSKARLEQELRLEVEKASRTPGHQRLRHGDIHYSDGLTRPLQQGHTMSFGLGGDRKTAAWAVENLDRAKNPQLYTDFLDDLTLRLAQLNYPEDLAVRIADELFSPETPMRSVHSIYQVNGDIDSIPLSLAVSPDNRIMDEVANALESFTDRKFHLQRLDVLESSLKSRFTGTGTGAKILDGSPDWQDSVFYRVHTQDFSGAERLDEATRKVMVAAPHPDAGVYPSTVPLGPPEPELFTTLEPTLTTWSPPPSRLGRRADQVAALLPPPEAGMDRIYGFTVRGQEGPVTWVGVDIEELMNTYPTMLPNAPLEWHFTDMPEGVFDDVMSQTLDLDTDLQAGLREHVERAGGAHRFARDVDEQVTDLDGVTADGWASEAVPFEHTSMALVENWRDGFSPQHYVVQHEESLRKLAGLRRPLNNDEITPELREVVERLGGDMTVMLDQGPAATLFRRLLSQKADELLIEGRKATVLPQRMWVDEDELEQIASQIGEWTATDLQSLYVAAMRATINPGEVAFTADELQVLGKFHGADPEFEAIMLEAGVPPSTVLIDAAGQPTEELLAYAPDLEGAVWHAVARGEAGEGASDVALTLQEALEKVMVPPAELADFDAAAMRARIIRAREAGDFTEPIPDLFDADPVAVRNEVVPDLDRLLPGWRTVEGWDKPGTGKLFGIPETTEPVREGTAKRILTNGVTPGQRNNRIVDDQVDELMQALTNAASGSQSEFRVLHEMLTPMVVDGRQAINVELVRRPQVQEMASANVGQVYATQEAFRWPAITNFFFDNIAGKAIKAMVREPLFATNYLQARRLADPIIDALSDPRLRGVVAGHLDARGDMTIDDLDKVIELERMGVLNLPTADPSHFDWTEYVTDIDNPSRWTGGIVDHKSRVDSWTASVLREPNPTYSIEDANAIWRRDLGLSDTPARQAIRKEIAAAREKIQDAADQVYYDLRASGASQEEALDTLKIWENENRELHDLLIEEARQRGILETSQAREAGQQLMLNPEELKAQRVAAGNSPVIEADDFSNDFSIQEMADIRRYMNQRRNALDAGRDAAINRAFQGTIPFIDDHRIRSQFQEYVGNLVPFWFAEEQFLKRWARVMQEAPDSFRKGQLLMHGLRTIGFVKTDMDGNDYYVYPGGQVVTDMLHKTGVSKLLFGADPSTPVSLSLTGDVKYTLPGFGDQMGVPSAGPMVGIALEGLASRYPEWAKVQTAVMGQRGSNRPILTYLVPNSVQKVYDAVLADADTSQMQSAMIQAAQVMEASGNGLSETATADEKQAYIDQVEANARTVLLSRAMLGFMGPSSPSISAELPLAEEFRALTLTGIPYTEALALFAETHDGDISPYTVFKSEVPSNAPLRSDHEALMALDQYDTQLAQFPMAAPWMLLPFHTPGGDEFDNRAYRTQIRMGLRKMRSADEYISALAWADASPEYFKEVENYDAQIEAFRLLDAPDMVRSLEQEKAAWQTTYKNLHPIFADKLVSSEGRTERQQILREAFTLMDVPTVANAPRVAPMRELLQTYRVYDDQLTGLNTSRSKDTLLLRDTLTMQFQGWLNLFLRANPELRYFYDRVLRPELRWDQGEVAA